MRQDYCIKSNDKGMGQNGDKKMVFSSTSGIAPWIQKTQCTLCPCVCWKHNKLAQDDCVCLHGWGKTLSSGRGVVRSFHDDETHTSSIKPLKDERKERREGLAEADKGKRDFVFIFKGKENWKNTRDNFSVIPALNPAAVRVSNIFFSPFYPKEEMPL